MYDVRRTYHKGRILFVELPVIVIWHFVHFVLAINQLRSHWLAFASNKWAKLSLPSLFLSQSPPSLSPSHPLSLFLSLSPRFPSRPPSYLLLLLFVISGMTKCQFLISLHHIHCTFAIIFYWFCFVWRLSLTYCLPQLLCLKHLQHFRAGLQSTEIFS